MYEARRRRNVSVRSETAESIPFSVYAAEKSDHSNTKGIGETHSTNAFHSCLWTLTIGKHALHCSRIYKIDGHIGTASQRLLRYSDRSQVLCEPVRSGEPDHARQVSHTPHSCPLVSRQ